MTDLTQAIAEIRRVTPLNSPWEAGDIGVGSSPVDYHIATILNAVASGDMIPLADHKLAVAMVVEKAAQSGYVACAETRHVSLGNKVRDTICALIPDDALAEVQALRAANEQFQVMAAEEQRARKAAEAELAATQAKLARVVEAIGITAEEATSIEIPGGFIPQETPDWHRGYDAAIHKARAALEGAKP